MTSPFFSIVIPAYNRSNEIQKTLISVKEQTFQDFECIIVDDGSRDSKSLKEIISNLNDARFKYIHQENAGASAARNHGVEKAVGKWIAYLDSDDIFLPHKLEVSASAIDESNKMKVLFSAVEVDRGKGVRLVKPHRGPRAGERIDEYQLCDRGFIQTSTIVIARELALDVKFSHGLPASQDVDFAIRVWLAGGQFVMIKEPLVIWNDMPSGNRISSNRHYEPQMRWIDNLKPFISDKAYWGYMGWKIAKMKRESGLIQPLSLFFQALLRGCYSPKLAATIIFQIALSANQYRWLADNLIKRAGASV